MDGVGAGELPDARAYGDQGVDTLGNLSRAFAAQEKRTLALPNLEKLGLGSLTSIQGVAAQGTRGGAGRAIELSAGKDTTSGHWEMAGLVVTKAFATFPNGFDAKIVERWCKENNLPGVLGNKAASGTEIIDEYGAEHLRTGKPILYTSADSVWQVAAHEEAFGLQRLYEICYSARKLCDELQIGRVIARPFIGKPGAFTRTYNRKDLAQPPTARSHLDLLVEQKIETLGVGKISSIYAGHGIQNNIDTKGNADGMRAMAAEIKKGTRGLIYNNLIDFDMLYGHRRDVPGFGRALEALDQDLGPLLDSLTERDLLVIAADHGNDPTFAGSDHTREHIPVLAYSPAFKNQGTINLGTRASFADVGATVFEALTGKTVDQFGLAGRSFLPELSGQARRA